MDRLLASRAFGERWARHWLDLVGYADQVGTSNSVFAQHAWRYRDYVISAYNDDKPFDDFIREQIAGDLLKHDTPQAQAASITATGFLVLGDVEIVEADKEKLLVDIVDQQLNKVGKAFLGLTLECARCHDHKFDPIPQRDYYAMGGFFHGTSSVFKTERGVWSDIHVLDLPETDEQKAERAKRQKLHAEKLKALETEREEAKKRKAELDGQLKKSDLAKEDRDRLTKERDAKNGRIGQLNREIEHARFFAPTAPRVHGVMEGDPQDMRITIRGNPRALGDSVPRGFLQVSLPAGESAAAKIEDSQSGRREFAEWITRQPLAARVVVNRIWQKLFGERDRQDRRLLRHPRRSAFASETARPPGGWVRQRRLVAETADSAAGSQPNLRPRQQSRRQGTRFRSEQPAAVADESRPARRGSAAGWAPLCGRQADIEKRSTAAAGVPRKRRRARSEKRQSAELPPRPLAAGPGV